MNPQSRSLQFILHPSSFILAVWWTWHDLNVRPRPSQSRALIPLSYRSELVRASSRGVSDPSFLAPNLPAARSTIRTQAMAEMERFERSQDFSRHLSGVLPCQLGDISKMAEGYGVEPYTVINRRSFQDCLTHSTVGPS